MSSPESGLPNIAEILGPALQRLPREQAPLFIAIAERMAAARYREWAARVTEPTSSSELLACADREEDIARRVEALYTGSAAIQRDIRTAAPDLEELNRSIFAGRSLRQQFAIQAQGERAGAATWRSFAEHETNAQARATFLACAELEEVSAAVLESLLRGS
ncbi:MAG: hypothetical protein HY271_11085 [Deltaproteobacteria bacterium]|nr:hypothetical protein [Deltaproteobacteria bacterium]